MYYFLLILSLIFLFYLLGKFADLVVVNVRKLGEELDIKVFFLGIILGLFTSLPELSLGINSFIDGLQQMSLGNLLGGVIILFTLILGTSVIINRKISTHEILNDISPILLFLLLPITLGLRGSLGLVDGIIIIVSYVILVVYLFKKNNHITTFGINIANKKETLKRVGYIIVGVVLVMFTSNFIIDVTERLIAYFNLPVFLVGLLFFSIGTNLPEITLVVRSWLRGAEDLSLSNLFGSAMANILLIGIFISMREITVPVDMSYVVLVAMYALIFLLLILFARSNKEFKRIEGVVLLILYILFLLTQGFLFLR
jgi:cation:H+ antiporter